MIDQLPEELLQLCVDSCSRSALKTLRLLCKSTNPSATKGLFAQVILKHEHESSMRCLHLMNSRNLRRLVYTVTLQTSDRASDRCEGYVPKEEDSTPEFDLCCSMLGKFSNVRRVELRHDPQCAQPALRTEERLWPQKVESIEFRDHVLKTITEGLSHPKHPATNVTELSIFNMQAMRLEDTQFSSGFQTVLRQLKTLALHIISEDPWKSGAYTTIDGVFRLATRQSMVPMLHGYFDDDLRYQWLDSTQNSLTSLALYADVCWGVYPSCSLHDTRFPHLTELAMGRYTFAHDEQLDWIFAHSTTLTSLILDDCPIVHEWYMQDGYGELEPLTFDEDNGEPEPSFRRYETRWHTYLNLIKDHLPDLSHFAMGQTLWKDKGELAMAKRHELTGYCLGEFCYKIFADGEFQDAYFYNDGTAPSSRDLPLLYDECGPEDGRWRPEYPDCYEEDLQALKELIEAVRGRRRPRL